MIFSIFLNITDEPVMRHRNFDLKNIHTPIDVLKLKYWLDKSEYDKEEANFLLDGFTHGFTIGYQGEVCRQDTSKNIPLNIGSSTEL